MDNRAGFGTSGAIGTLAGNVVEAVVPKPPVGHALTERMFKGIEQLFALANSLENAADRLVGVPPAKPAGTTAQSTPQSHAGRLDMALEGIEALNGSLSETLSRIERFI